MTYTVYRRTLLNRRLIDALPILGWLISDNNGENDCHLYISSLPDNAVQVDSISSLTNMIPQMRNLTTGKCLPVFIKIDNRFTVNYLLSNQFNSSESLDENCVEYNAVQQSISNLIAKGRLYVVDGLEIEYSLNKR